jgi:hypothetical protein
MEKIGRTVFSVVFFVLLFLSQTRVYAADFKTAYEIEYFVQDNDLQGFTKAAYTIRLTNTKPDLIIKTFTLSFPKSFGTGNIAARDNKGPIIPKVTEKDRYIDVALTFNDPTPGLNEVNTLYLDFLQKNIFRQKGSVWELFIPTMPTDEYITQSLTVYLPPGKHKKLSLSKPLPDLISFDKVVWNSVKGKSIYAIFGQSQRYNLNLTYDLQNPNIYQVYTDVAFPPETLYQQIYVSDILPKPDLVFSDTDGNFMGRYYLKPQEKKQIIFTGQAEVFASPRTEFIPVSKGMYEKQKQTLFNPQKFWNLPGSPPVTSSSIRDHYQYVVNTLSYNFGRLITGTSRMGAGDAIRYPDQAVCTEYSDLLVASARSQRISIREVQGYAFAQEQELRPVQSQSDILHSWVEYYDESKNIWVPVDPTWEDTSGIDYFDSLDVNHIVFAIHGKQAEYPYPAGSYKLKPGGVYVRVEPTADQLSGKSVIDVSFSDLGIPSVDQGVFSTKATVTNTGSVALWNSDITIGIKGGKLKTKQLTIDRLYPGERLTSQVEFIPDAGGAINKVELTASFQGMESPPFVISVPTFIPGLKRYIVPIGIILSGLFILGLVLKRKNDN